MSVIAETALDISIQNLLLSQENERLRAENDRLSRAVCSGILGDLLDSDESEALVAFVKRLRSASAETPKGQTDTVKGTDI